MIITMYSFMFHCGNNEQYINYFIYGIIWHVFVLLLLVIALICINGSLVICERKGTSLLQFIYSLWVLYSDLLVVVDL